MAAPTAAARKPGTFTFAQSVTGDTVLSTPANGVYCGSAGTITVTMDGDGADVEFTVTAGMLLRIRISGVNATGVTGVVVLW